MRVFHCLEVRSRSDAIRRPFWDNFVRPGGQMNVEMPDKKIGKKTPQTTFVGIPKVPEYWILCGYFG